ncbi:MAG: 1-acyl-sn-glycerol-3-phosphate acyltransferase [Nitrospirae bacterium]|nr:1-acyl-sn-glycerol-3-phosphate acyltransferase [Nitrospirota bacterium]
MDSYKTTAVHPSFFARVSPTIYTHCSTVKIVLSGSHKAKRGRYDTAEWIKSSLDSFHSLEGAGVRFEIEGINNFRDLKDPCVFIANHMSTLETFILPCIIAPFKDVTFVVKEALINYPVFKHMMRSRNPITVTRTNPRKDLKAVLGGGVERLKAGLSIIIFPQATRALDIDPAAFNTLGVKLAKRAVVPIIPVALKTDAWNEGRWLKDFGRIDPSRRAHFAFGEPIIVKESGDDEHQQVINFIQGRLKEWA